MTKLKILYIITKSGVGGAQKYVTDLAENLDSNLFDIKILYGGKDIRWLSNRTYPWLLFFNDWLAILELIKIYKKEQPDIIHLNSSKTGVLGSVAAYVYNLKAKSYEALPTGRHIKVNIVFTAHGWVFNPTNSLPLPVRWFYILLHKFAALFQDKIICVSEYDYKLALQYHIAPGKKIISIHNGINPNIKFLDKQTAKKEIIGKLKTYNLKLKTEYPWVGSIGRLVKEKDYETFIKAATLMPNTYFFIIGSGPEQKNIELEIMNYELGDRFFIIGPTGNDAQYLKAFDIFAMSSVKEGFPYILLEAMAAELPIVVTEAGGMPEIIENHENGLMVAQKNPEALAKAIQGLLTNKSVSNELKKEALNAVQNKFGLEKMIIKTEGVYKENL